MLYSFWCQKNYNTFLISVIKKLKKGGEIRIAKKVTDFLKSPTIKERGIISKS